MTGPSSSSSTTPSSSRSWSILCPQDGIWEPVWALAGWSWPKLEAGTEVGGNVAASKVVSPLVPDAWVMEELSPGPCRCSSWMSWVGTAKSPPRSKPALQGMIPLPRQSSGTVTLYIVISSASPIRTSTSEAKPKLRRDDGVLDVIVQGFVSQKTPL